MGPETQALVHEIRALRQEVGGLLQGIHQTLRESQISRQSAGSEVTERVQALEVRIEHVESAIELGFDVIADHLLPDLDKLMKRKAAHDH